MSAHQVITGALNRGEHVYAVGSVDGINFTVCAVGADIVILAPNFDRVQVIPGSNQNGPGHIVSSVSSCQDSGKIAATYGNVIRIFEPSHRNLEKSKHRLDYRWFETQSLTVKGPVSSVLWNMEGMQLLVSVREELLLFQHKSLAMSSNRSSAQPVMFSISEYEHKNCEHSQWDLIWEMHLSQPAKYIRYSPDGAFIATAGEDDHLVKIWYQDQPDDSNRAEFSFLTLYHPDSVKGFEWRQTGRYMPRRCIQNVLVTWCADNTSRIWKETPAPEQSLIDISGEGGEPTFVTARHKKLFGKHFNVKRTRTKIMGKLKSLVPDKKRKIEDSLPSQPAGLKAQFTKSPSFNDFPSPYLQQLEVRFHLSATINADTDCLLVPTMDGRCSLRKPFAVHWLNNKELVFSIGAEKLLAEALAGEFAERKSMSPVPDESRAGSEVTDSPEALSPDSAVSQNGTHVGGSVASDAPSAKDILDVKLEMLLRQWTKSQDVLFTVHPVDGSLLTWTVEWLDDINRQPSVSFSSRFPNAFPLTDASSLHLSLCTFNPHDPVYVEVLQKGPNAEGIAHSLDRRLPNSVFLLTNHENGSLNLWQLSMEESSHYTTILNISHLSRMCGHRFQMSQVVAHPVLPLMITTSQFTATEHVGENERKDSLSEVILWKINPVGPLCRSGGVRELARMAASSSSTFRHLAWVPAILPSCTLGSVCNSPSSCFVATHGHDLIVYQAVLDARGLLSEIYNAKRVRDQSPERDTRLSVSPRQVTESLEETFNVVSSQSTAKPGCVLQVASIKNTQNTSLHLLHVFNERLVVDNDYTHMDDTAITSSAVIDRSKACVFSDKYFVVMIEKGDVEDRFVMYSLNLSSQQPTPIPIYDGEDLPDDKGFLRPASPIAPSVARLHTETERVCSQKLPLPEGVRVISARPAAGHLSSSSLYPACKAPYVLVTSCSDDIIRFWKCVRTESSSGVVDYQWKEWRMVSDCRYSSIELEGLIYSLSAAHSGRIACAYDSRVGTWDRNEKPTRMRNGLHKREGCSIDIGVFECESSGGVEWMREDTLTIKDITFPQVLIPRVEDFNVGTAGTFDWAHSELSSTMLGGLPNGRPSSLLLMMRSRSNMHLAGTPECQLTHSAQEEGLKQALSSTTIRAQEAFDNMPISDMIRIDWVSTEDGGHILTVGLAANIYLYTQVSQDQAQKNIVAMKESEVSLRRPSLRKASSLAAPEHEHSRLTRWVCTRVLKLHSADGLPPIPTTLAWVRDGLLIVGMQSEMRVYNQWNLKPQQEDKPAVQPTIKRKGTASNTLVISPSHSMLDQLGKKAKDSDRQKNKLFIDALQKSLQPTKSDPTQDAEDEHFIESFSGLGLFEFSRNASPILPQYHPKQLIVLLNGGRTRRVKAILLHVLRSLKARQSVGTMSRKQSIRRMSTVDISEEINPSSGDQKISVNIDEEPNYDEIDDITPLPLYALIAADTVDSSEGGQRAQDIGKAKRSTRKSAESAAYDSLFGNGIDADEDLDAMLNDDDDEPSSRSRHPSVGSEGGGRDPTSTSVTFTAKHNRILTEMLTHAHLPGLSSVDQMHLLAIADTLSHFGADVMDKLTQANAAMQPALSSVLGDSIGGYATAAGGVDAVDECGLRFLMAMKQHEYLLLCLPIMQRQQLRLKGLSSAHIIWAQHSETETELLNAIPGMHKQSPSWEELRGLGAAWWLKNTASLKICVEKLAKAAFQQNQDPMDASLFYMALKKKNVLTHLFKTARDTRMAEFFMNDFNDPHWKKVAMKNAFVLMSKQRFAHAAAFFLLADCLRDAIQTILSRLNDLQLAMVVLRLYATDPETQQSMLKEMLCREVLGQTVDEFDSIRGKTDEDSVLPKGACSDPFERSMAYWVLKDYTRAAHTLVEEAASGRMEREKQETFTLANIFNFYTFLRRHPLVIRQRLTDAGSQVGSTEKFLAVAKQLEVMVTPAERRLFFRTAAEHMAHGCPILALDVLSRLPKYISMVVPGQGFIKALLNDPVNSNGFISTPSANDKVEAFDWAKPTNVIKEDELQLDWSDHDDEEKEENEEAGVSAEKSEGDENLNASKTEVVQNAAVSTDNPPGQIVDIIAQQLRFVAILRILTEELSTLASGYAVDGGQLRYQLFIWLEKEIEVLKELCDYRTSIDDDLDVTTDEAFESMPNSSSPMLIVDAHKSDRAEFLARIKNTQRRRKWLVANQKLLRSFTSYCSLHMAQNHRLTSALMELLLLLLEVQKDSGLHYLSEPIPESNSFPLLVASVSSLKMFVSSPLAFIETQCHDLLTSISDLTSVPQLKESALTKYSQLYGISLGLSSCLYQALCDVDHFNLPVLQNAAGGVLTRRVRRCSVFADELRVSTSPARWPGVDTLIALLGRERDEETPHLRLLLAECFVAVTMSLFTYALASYDARWLYRLAGHTMDPKSFAAIFGGGGEKKFQTMPPQRPPRPTVPARPPPPSVSSDQGVATMSDTSSTQGTTADQSIPVDSHTLRAKLHAKVFGADTSSHNSTPSMSGSVTPVIEQTVMRWVPPNKNIVQLFSDKPDIAAKKELDVDYDSEGEDRESNAGSDEEETRCEAADPESYAWHLIRLALVEQELYKLKQFLILAGFDPSDIPSAAPRICAVFRVLTSWSQELRQVLTEFPGGCPVDILPNTALDTTNQHLGPSLTKYRALHEPGNTPFESEDPRALPVKRLWAFFVRQDHLTNIFIRHIFSAQGQLREPSERNDAVSGLSPDGQLPEAYKIIQKEHEPIVAFACSQDRPGFIVVSTGRELQEMDITGIFEEAEAGVSWLNNRTELDVGLLTTKKDALNDNDDFQLFNTDGPRTSGPQLKFKRMISGIRRMDSHPSAPFYVTGSSDGSIRVWEWGVGQPVYTARVAGQHAKVTKITFSANGNKFAAVDGDGMLCLWQAGQAHEQKKPFFNQKCHSKSAADVRFLGHSASQLVTAGLSSGDVNLCLWDTLMPSARACVQSWNCHPEGATCALYIPSQQTIVSGGRHGEICLWDIRMHALRSTVKAFEPSQTVRSLVIDNSQDVIVAGSSDGDIKIWSAESSPQLMFQLIGEHMAKGGFSFRQVGQNNIQGVQQLYVDQQMRLFSCGADSALKVRTLPSVFNQI